MGMMVDTNVFILFEQRHRARLSTRGTATADQQWGWLIAVWFCSFLALVFHCS
jgi:hypothetical protein